MAGDRALEDVVADYIAAVGCRDAGRRRELIDRAVGSAFVFCSGRGESRGRAAFDAAIKAVQALLPPGAVLTRSTPIEEHHRRLRFGWCFVDWTTRGTYDDQPFRGLMRGMDFATLDDDGRLAAVTVFYDAGLTGDGPRGGLAAVNR
jgi:hypothetical protein